MTPITAFIVAAGLLLLIVLGILLRPLFFSKPPTSEPDQRDANLGIFRDQLRELEQDRESGVLAVADFEQARSELQRRLLEDVPGERTAHGSHDTTRGGRKTAMALLWLVPLAALGGYALLGKPQALDPAQTQPAPAISEQQIEEMLTKLADRLKANPDDAKGWVMLARSYRALGRYADAADAFSHAGALVDGDPVLLADYADVLAQTNNGRLDGQPAELVARALALNPDEPQALFLAGLAAKDRNDLKGLIDHWERLLPQLETGSQDANILGEAVAKARATLGLPVAATALAMPPRQPTAPQPGATATAGPEAISGELRLDSKLAGQTKPDDLLFVFARAPEGPRMPLAVMRLHVADLPFKFILDDSMALPGGGKISLLDNVTLEGRVAKAGMAQSASGDLFGLVKNVKPGSKDIVLVIDQIQP